MIYYAGKLGPWARNRHVQDHPRYLKVGDGYFKILSVEPEHGQWRYIICELEGWDHTWPAWCGTNTYTMKGETMGDDQMVEITIDGRKHVLSARTFFSMMMHAKAFEEEWIAKNRSITFNVDEERYVDLMVSDLEAWAETHSQILGTLRQTEDLYEFVRAIVGEA